VNGSNRVCSSTTEFMRLVLVCLAVVETVGLFVGTVTIVMISALLSGCYAVCLRLALIVVTSGFGLTVVPALLYSMVMSALLLRIPKVRKSLPLLALCSCVVTALVYGATILTTDRWRSDLFALFGVLGHNHLEDKTVMSALFVLSVISGLLGMIVLRHVYRCCNRQALGEGACS
jgi:hypothetical protein